MKKTIYLLSFFLAAFLLLNPATAGESPPPALSEIKAVVNRDYLPIVLKMIAGAKTSIDFIQLEFHYDPTVKKIQDALRAAVKRGVKVRGLLEDNIRFNATSAEYLNSFGITTKLDTPAKMTHNKLFIVDQEKVLLGSTNLSSNSIDNNNETNVYLQSPQLGAFFTRYFERLFKDSRAEPLSETLELPEVTTVINRQHVPVLLKLFDGAQKKIQVLMYGMSYNANYPDSSPNRLIDALIAARARGVKVEVILDKSDYNQIINEVNAATRQHLEKGGVTVRYDPEEITTHAKLLIIDDQAVVGSPNWGYKALDVRNECSLIISDPKTVESFRNYFRRIWKEGGGEAKESPPPSAQTGISQAAKSK